jgi:hypothetical protein
MLSRMRNCGGQSFVNFDVIQIAERSLQVLEDFGEASALDRLFSFVKQPREKFGGIAELLDRNPQFVPTLRVELLAWSFDSSINIVVAVVAGWSPRR